MFYDIRRYIFSQSEPNRTDAILKNLEPNRNRLGSVRFETEPIPSLFSTLEFNLFSHRFRVDPLI